MRKIIKRVVMLTLVSGVIIGGIAINRADKSKADEQIKKDFELSRRTNIEVDASGKLSIKRNPLKCVSMGKENTWTLFVYMCGSDLESDGGCASADIKEMISANESENVNIVIQTGGSNSWNKQNIDPNRIGRYVIENNNLKLVESHPDSSMGDYKTLKSFLKWGIEKYPAENMGIVLWNHGGGPIDGVCYNEKYDYDSLSLSEIEMALESVSSKMTDKFQMISFDACLMSTIEVANMLSPYADYMIASQQSEPGDGWEYKSVVNALVNNSDIKGDKFGKEIVDGFIKNVKENEDGDDEYATLSVIDLDKIDDLLVSFNDVAKNMDNLATNNTVLNQLTEAATESIEVGSGDFDFGLVDLYDYVSRVSELVDGTETVKAAINNVVIYEKHCKDSPNAHGINFYYPIAETGFGNLMKLRNVLTSPFYANYIDKMEHYYNFIYKDMIAQGFDMENAFMYDESYFDSYVESPYNLEDYKDNNWESSSYFYEKTFEFTEYQFTDVDEYLELSEFPYYKDVEFDDTWFNMYYAG